MNIFASLFANQLPQQGQLTEGMSSTTMDSAQTQGTLAGQPTEFAGLLTEAPIDPKMDGPANSLFNPSPADASLAQGPQELVQVLSPSEMAAFGVFSPITAMQNQANNQNSSLPDPARVGAALDADALKPSTPSTPPASPQVAATPTNFAAPGALTLPKGAEAPLEKGNTQTEKVGKAKKFDQSLQQMIMTAPLIQTLLSANDADPKALNNSQMARDIRQAGGVDAYLDKPVEIEGFLGRLGLSQEEIVQALASQQPMDAWSTPRKILEQAGIPPTLLKALQAPAKSQATTPSALPPKDVTANELETRQRNRVSEKKDASALAGLPAASTLKTGALSSSSPKTPLKTTANPSLGMGQAQSMTTAGQMSSLSTMPTVTSTLPKLRILPEENAGLHEARDWFQLRDAWTNSDAKPGWTPKNTASILSSSSYIAEPTLFSSDTVPVAESNASLNDIDPSTQDAAWLKPVSNSSENPAIVQTGMKRAAGPTAPANSIQPMNLDPLGVSVRGTEAIEAISLQDLKTQDWSARGERLEDAQQVKITDTSVAASPLDLSSPPAAWGSAPLVGTSLGMGSDSGTYTGREMKGAQDVQAIMQQITDVAQSGVHSTGGQIQLQIPTEVYGNVGIQIQVENESVRLKISSRDDDLKDGLISAMDGLTAQLKGQNLELVDVKFADSGSSSFLNQHSNSGQDQGHFAWDQGMREYVDAETGVPDLQVLLSRSGKFSTPGLTTSGYKIAADPRVSQIQVLA